MKNSGDELARLSQVIGLIYEGATDPTRWSKDIVPAMADYLAVPACALFTASHAPKDGGYCFFQGGSQDRMDLFMSQYLNDIPWVEPAARKGLIQGGNVILGDELISAEQWLASRLYNDCFGRSEYMAKMMTGIVFGMEANDIMGTVYAVYRGLDAPFGEPDRSQLKLLLPHISRSLGVMQRLRAAELTVATTLAALDRLPSGVLLLDDAGRVDFANQAAQRMLGKGDGLRLRKSAYSAGLWEIDADEPALSRSISAAIHATLKRDPHNTPHFSKSVVVPQRSGLGNYALQFSALGNQNEFGGGHGGHAAIVFLADSAHKPSIDPAVLQGAYGLTAAEARVAITLLEHVSAKEAAQVLGVSPNTVRAQTQSIYGKLGVDTRARFVKIMLGLASQAH